MRITNLMAKLHRIPRRGTGSNLYFKRMGKLPGCEKDILSYILKQAHFPTFPTFSYTLQQAHPGKSNEEMDISPRPIEFQSHAYI